jgi:hypothetical protein
MKKLLIPLLSLCCISSSPLAQSCLPQGIEFYSQAQIDSFPLLFPGCSVIEGGVSIHGDDIANLNGLNGVTEIGGDLIIGSTWFEYDYTNFQLFSLEGLDNLQSVAGSLRIINNYSLESLNGLENLVSVAGALIFSYNLSLESLTALVSLDSIGDYIYIGPNAALTALTGLEPSFFQSDLSIGGNDALVSLAGLEKFPPFQANLSIAGNGALTSFSGAEQIGQIGGNLLLAGNNAVTSLQGFENLSSVGGYLYLLENAALASLDGLDNLTAIGKDLQIQRNPSLASLDGLENLTTIARNLLIDGNPSLTSLHGLSGLTSVKETIEIIENDALTSLDGLDNIDYHSFDFLTLVDCPALYDCSVKPVCDHLQNGGSANISGNAFGCSIIFEVMAACQVAADETSSADGPILISPNPASGIVWVEIRAPGLWNIVLRDVMGHAVFGQKALGQEAQLDLSPLPAGVYFAELRSGERLLMRRIVKH